MFEVWFLRVKRDWKPPKKMIKARRLCKLLPMLHRSKQLSLNQRPCCRIVLRSIIANITYHPNELFTNQINLGCRYQSLQKHPPGYVLLPRCNNISDPALCSGFRQRIINKWWEPCLILLWLLFHWKEIFQFLFDFQMLKRQQNPFNVLTDSIILMEKKSRRKSGRVEINQIHQEWNTNLLLNMWLHFAPRPLWVMCMDNIHI